MKFDFKKSLKVSSLSLLILLNCGWTPVTPISSNMVNGSTTINYSSCDDDLLKLNIDKSKYQEYDYSLALFIEVNDSLILYMYDKYENFNYAQIDFEFCSAVNENSLSLMKTNHVRRDLELLSTSSDGLFKKLLIKEIKTPEGNFRKYVINQVVSGDYVEDTKEYLALAIGTEYIYSTNPDGTLSYNEKAVNYVTIQNQEVYHYNIKYDEKYLSGFHEFFDIPNASVGSRYGFVGFSAEQLKINSLQEVEVLYDVYDYTCWVPTSDLALPNIYNEENLKKFKEQKPQFDYVNYLSDFAEKKVLVEKDKKVVITPKEISQDKFDDENHFAGTTIQNMRWNTIMKYEDIDKYFNSDEYARSNADMKDKFKNSDFIITFFKAKEKYGADNGQLNGFYFSESKSKYYAQVFDNQDIDDFDLYCWECDSPCSTNEIYHNGSKKRVFTRYSFESQEASNVCIVRLKYMDEFNGVHDVKVISSPVDSSGNIAGGDETHDDDWWHDFIEGLKTIIIIVIVTIGLMILIPILIPLMPVIVNFISNLFRFVFGFIGLIITKLIQYIQLGINKLREFISRFLH